MRSIPIAILAAASLAVAAPRPARAQTIGTDLSGVMAIETAIEIGGVVTDVAIPISLETTGHVSLWFSIPGTVIWSINGLAGLELLALAQGGGYFSNDGATVDVFLGITAGSLALSIYGIVHHPPPVSVTPTALRAPSGNLVPALAVSARW